MLAAFVRNLSRAVPVAVAGAIGLMVVDFAAAGWSDLGTALGTFIALVVIGTVLVAGGQTLWDEFGGDLDP